MSIDTVSRFDKKGVFLRSQMMFLIGFFLLATVLTAFIIVPQINQTFEEQHANDIKVELELEAALFQRFVDVQKTILKDLSSLPMLINAVMLSSADNPELADLLNSFSIAGKQGHFLVQDIAGDVVFKTDGVFDGSYTEGAKWLDDIVEDKRPYYFKLLGQRGDDFTFQMSVPVRYQNFTEGVLSVEITVPLSSVFVTQLYNTRVAFKLAQDKVVVQTAKEHITLPHEEMKELDIDGLKFSYIIDVAPLREAEGELKNTILMVLFIGFAISFVLLFVFGYRSLSDGAEQILISRRVYVLPMVVCFVGIAATFAALFIAQNLRQKRGQDDVIVVAKNIVQELKQKITLNFVVLDSLQAFYQASNFVDHEEFQTFAKPILAKNPAVQAVEWIPRVKHEERSVYESNAKKNDAKNFAFSERSESNEMIPAAERDEYFPVYYVEPIEGNENALGFDLGSNEQRLEALIIARDGGKRVATSPVELVQYSGRELGVLVFNPYYGKALPRSKDARKKDIKGFTLMVLQIDTLVNEALGGRVDDFVMSIEDATELNNIEIIYGPDDLGEINLDNGVYGETINFAGRQWRVRIKPIVEPAPQGLYFWVILAGGIGFTLLITFILLQLSRRSEVVEKTVELRTAELQESEQRYDMAVNGSSVGLWDWDIVAGTLYWSPRFKEICGITAEDYIPELGEFEDRLHPNDRDRIMTALFDGHLKEHKRYDVEYRLRHNDGSYIWIHARGQASWDADGNAVRMAGSADDISSRKATEQQLEDAKIFQNLINESNPDFFYVKDACFKIVEANQAFLSMYPEEIRESVIGTTTLENYSDSARESLLEMDRLAFEVGISDVTEVVSFPDGSKRTLQTKKIRFGSMEGELFILCMSRDVTEREDLLEKLMYSYEDLEQSNLQIDVEKAIAVEANKAKSMFLANMSHEIRTPLNGIIGMSELLMSIGGLDEKQTKYINTIFESGDILLELINDILDFSKIEAGELTLESRAVQVSSIFDQLKAMFVSQAAKGDVNLNIASAADIPVIKSDETRIRQVLINFTSNAIKFSPKGNVYMRANMFDVDGVAMLRFEVQDTGIGIAQDKTDAMFDSFSQVDTSTTRQFGGTGLGLAICKKLVELFGGRIGVDSVEGQGSTFWFEIPANIQAGVPVELVAPAPVRGGMIDADDEKEEGPAKGKRILVVEDNITNQAVQRAYLEKLRYDMGFSINGKEAVDELMQSYGEYDAILMDCQMPVMDGFEATNIIRLFEAERGLGRIPIIALTANAMKEDKHNCFAAGMDDYLSKPIRMTVLEEMLEKWFSK
jgi:PAS domain S-box-containing protein